jgi:hypothetical protein
MVDEHGLLGKRDYSISQKYYRFSVRLVFLGAIATDGAKTYKRSNMETIRGEADGGSAA